MTKRAERIAGLLVALSAVALAAGGCSGSSAGATPGGAQDNDLGKAQVNQGQVPQPSAFTVEGLLNEYDLPLEDQPCDKVLCISAAYGVAPVLVEDRSAVFVQIGFSSGFDEKTFRRSPLNLSVVVDRSGSMAGSKMDSVKLALSHLIDQLGEGDRLSIVLFDNLVDVLVEPTLVGDKAALKSAVAQIYARGSTDMASGLRTGSNFVKQFAGQPGISDRVIVFTDAMTNTGDTDQSTFIQIATSDAAQNIGITLFGVGTDLNQDLVLAISEIRGGNYFFLEDAKKISTVFDQDFDFLVTPLAYDLHLTLQPASGFYITAVYGFPSWRTGSATVDLVVPTVFLSRNHGALVVRLDPSARQWPTGQSPLASLGLTFTAAGDGSRVTDSLEASYTSSDALSDSTIFYSQRAVRKSVALVNEVLGEIQATQIYWNRSSGSADPVALLERVRAMLLSESATLEDADLATEAGNVLKLENNMQRPSSTYGTGGSYGSTYPDQNRPVACSFAAGRPAAGSLFALVMVAVGGAAFGRIRRRHRAVT